MGFRKNHPKISFYRQESEKDKVLISDNIESYKVFPGVATSFVSVTSDNSKILISAVARH